MTDAEHLAAPGAHVRHDPPAVEPPAPQGRFASPQNLAGPVAAQGEFAPLTLGALSIWPPVVLAPMAGVTNFAFRSLCREFGAGLYFSEMITARGYLHKNRLTMLLASSHEDETPRSVQIYGSDPVDVGEMARALVDDGVEHIDMNFGCPVRKVTRRGGGAAIPAKPRLLARLVRAAVQHAGDIPVTIKFRVGIDDDVHTYLDSGRVAEQEGCAAVSLHARTAAQLYDGDADWDTIAELKRAVSIPVFGNGDIWEAWDALRMMRTTGCDGVVVGRGCLGRPWLFRDLADVFAGREPSTPPRLGEIAPLMLEHAELLAQWLGEEAGIRSFRKHATWYTKGFADSTQLRGAITRITTFQQLEDALALTNGDLEFPPEAMRMKRGKKGGRQKVSLPAGYLDDLFDATPPGPLAEDPVSGG